MFLGSTLQSPGRKVRTIQWKSVSTPRDEASPKAGTSSETTAAVMMNAHACESWTGPTMRRILALTQRNIAMNAMAARTETGVSMMDFSEDEARPGPM